MNNTIKFPTMDAINFSRMIAYNAMVVSVIIYVNLILYKYFNNIVA